MESFKKPWAGVAVCLAWAVGCGQTARPEEPEAVGTEARELMTFSRPAELVRDINPRPVPNSGSDPGNLAAVGGTLYFSARTDAQGNELWRSDGTPEGTVCLDIVPGTGHLDPSLITEVNGTLFFTGNPNALLKSDGTAAGTVVLRSFPYVTGSAGPERLTHVGGTLFFISATEEGKLSRLWKSDGTAAGTVRVKDIQVVTDNANRRHLVNAGGRVFFRSSDTATGLEPWVSDGTEAGTKLLKDLVPGAAGSTPRELTGVGSTLFFIANDGTSKTLLWKSDGTEAGTVPVPVPSKLSSPLNLAAMNGVLYFQAYHSDYGIELWRTDGTAAGTMLVKDIATSYPVTNSMPANLKAVGNTLYFTAEDSLNGAELWRSDGTAAGTVLVKDFTPGSAGSTFTNLTAVGGTLFFTANDGTSGLEVWKSDGTAAGTVRVKDLLPGTASASPSALTDVGGQLAFVANDPATGSEVWWSDGTEAGTRILKDISGPNAGSSPSTFVQLGDALLFFAFDGVSGRELWRTDGTAAGTSLLKDVNPGVKSARDTTSTYQQRVVGSTLYFTADDGVSGAELWRTDGTAAGTSLVKDIRPGLSPSSFTFVGERNGTLFLSAYTDTEGTELWKTDGTAAGTVMVKDIWPGTGRGLERIEFVQLNGVLYFPASDGSTSGMELWKSDGTAAGTVRVKDLYPGATGSSPQQFQVMNGAVYFAAEDGVSGQELWKTDGTAAGTVRVKDLYPGTGSGYPSDLRVMNGTLYFTATTSTNGRELWKSDGTEAGTVMVKDIYSGTGDANPSAPIPLGGLLFFTANDGSSGHEMWRSDGTAAGTFLLKDVRPGSVSSGSLRKERLGERLFFVANDGTTGDELWVTDGTKAGTVLVKDVLPGAESSEIRELYPLEPEGLMVFAATDVSGGRELWASDGTAAGTRRLTDLKLARAAYDNPRLPVRLGDRLLFVADDGKLGAELWSLPPGPPPDTTPPTLVCPSVHEEEATDASGAVVAAVAVSASDGVTASPVVRYSPALGTVFPLGSSALTVTAEDAAGNTSTCAITVRVLDRTAPVPSCPGDVTEEATGPMGALVSYSPATAVEAVSQASFSYSQDSGTVFPLGSTPVTATAKDEAGNTASCGFTVKVRDTTAPLVACPGDSLAEATDASGADVVFTLAPPKDAVTSALAVSLSHASGSRFPLGTTPVSLSATDEAGNTASCGFTVTVRDTTPPTLVCWSILEEAMGPEGTAVWAMAVSASDGVTASPVVRYSHALGTVFPLGRTVVTATAEDGAGNTASCAFFVSVQDGTPPELTCPGDLVVEATSAAGAAVTYEPASATDAVTASPPVVHDHESGSTFPLGETRVTASAADEAGNTGSCSFTVKVRDTTPPLVGCPPDTTVEAEDASGADVVYMMAQPNDAVTRAPVVSASHAAGSRFPLGTTPVSVSATDEAGNTASCGFTVTVRDSTAPVLVCPADITVDAGVGEGVPVLLPRATASDAVTAELEVAYSPASGSFFPSGTTRVTASTVDGMGQRAECSFQVTVRNATPPPIIDPPPVSEPVGCACSAPGAGGSAPGAVWWLLLGVGMLWSGRRRTAVE